MHSTWHMFDYDELFHFEFKRWSIPVSHPNAVSEIQQNIQIHTNFLLSKGYHSIGEHRSDFCWLGVCSRQLVLRWSFVRFHQCVWALDPLCSPCAFAKLLHTIWPISIDWACNRKEITQNWMNSCGISYRIYPIWSS